MAPEEGLDTLADVARWVAKTDIGEQAATCSKSDSGNHEDWSEEFTRYDAVLGFKRDRRGSARPLSAQDRERLIATVLREYLSDHPAETAAFERGAPARVHVRLPGSIRDAATRCASKDGVSLNAWVAAAVAVAVGRHDRVAEKIAAQSRMIDAPSSH